MITTTSGHYTASKGESMGAIRSVLALGVVLATLALLGCGGETISARATADVGAAELAASFRGTLVLGSPTATSIQASILSPNESGTIYVAFGTTSGAYDRETAASALQAAQPLEVPVAALLADTEYYGRLYFRGAGEEAWSVTEEFAFHTARPAGSTFTFCIQGDSHPERVGKQFDPALYVRTLESAASVRPDFFFTLGDDFSVDQLKTVSAETVQSLYATQRDWLSLVGAPVFLVGGNHEQASLANLDGTSDNVAVWAQTARNAYYSQPAPNAFYSGDAEPVDHIGLLRDYYAFTWGDALFVVIDPYWHSAQPVDNAFGADRDEKRNRDLWDITLGDAQYEWLAHTLETSTAKVKFVFAHHVNGTGRGGIELATTYEWGDAAGLPIHRPGWDRTIHQLLVDHHVTIFFQGHDHLFARQELDGVIYQTLPEPANPYYTLENAVAYKNGDMLPNSGHVRVSVSPGGVKVDYVRSYLDRPDELAFSYAVDSPLASRPAGSTPPTEAATVILGRPTANSVTVSLLAPTAQQVVIAYGREPGRATHGTAPILLQADAPQEIEITSLDPDATYYYRWISDGVPSDEHSFHTQRAPGSAFTFTIDADPHNGDPRFNGELYATTLANALADGPDFHINLGDTFMTEKIGARTYAEAADTFTDMRPYFAALGADAALFLVNGNHEGELGWLLTHPGDTNLPIWSTLLRQRYYPSPVPTAFYTGGSAPDPYLGEARDGFYSWTWGDALFIVLDPFWYTTQKPAPGGGDANWGWTLGRAQYDGLREALETSDAQFKFIFVHHLVGGGSEARGGIEVAEYYEWGGRNADGTYGFDLERPGWGKPVHQLLVENRVSAVFHGHDHVFVKQDLDGIVYQEVPQPSQAEYNNTRIAADYGYTQGDMLGSSGHLCVTVAPEQVTVEYVRAYLPRDEKPGQQNGQVDYTYSIP
jgi:phosphodiesterase/alkaline phosphatase D-like protein